MNNILQVQQRNLGVSGRIFAIDNQRTRLVARGTLKLRVNFLPEIIQLSKEVRFMFIFKLYSIYHTRVIKWRFIYFKPTFRRANFVY